MIPGGNSPSPLPAQPRRYSPAGFAHVLALCGLLLLAGPAAQAGELDGTVVAVTDGDTLKVLSEGREVVIRLDQVDAPEKRQAFGDRARQSLAGLVFHQPVRVETHGRDRYGRTIATVFVGELDVNAEQVRRGMAWVYVRYARDRALFALEAEARAARRGLWDDPEPVPPWAWRHHR